MTDSKPMGSLAEMAHKPPLKPPQQKGGRCARSNAVDEEAEPED